MLAHNDMFKSAKQGRQTIQLTRDRKLRFWHHFIDKKILETLVV